MRKAIFGLGFFLLIACGGSSDSKESDLNSAAASGGEDASDGGSGHGETGGSANSPSSGKGGASSGGAPAGGSPSGGANQGGSNQGGTTSAGGDAGEGLGGTAAASGSTAASGGVAGTVAPGTGGRSGDGGSTGTMCDPVTGGLDNTPYPDCEPRSLTDPCELCIQARCCEESKVCYGYDPMNVCGWGGPTTGNYAGSGEIDCYIACAREYVAENGVYDDQAADVCVPACTTAECGLIGDATQDLVVCLQENCESECFGP